MLKKWVFTLGVLAMATVLSGAVAAAQSPSAMEPAASGGLELIERSLAQLSGHRRLLVVGAHPDDEDNALLSHVSHGLGGEVAYLSLSRGEGGQNLIGSELGADLGVIRTGELLAARELENGRQYFTRAFDFGYTRSLDETFSRWPREALTIDAVRIARRFKPQVVVAVFPASNRAGHGQHQASAVVARDLFELAGDPGAFPDLAEEGLAPWSPDALYRRAWDLTAATVTYDLGSLEASSGRSLGQLAAASRSFHRSQDMGRLQRLGVFRGGLVRIGGSGGANAQSVFDGVDTRLAAIAARVEDVAARRRLEELLGAVEDMALETREKLTPVKLSRVVDSLAGIARRLDEARATAEAAGAPTVVELIAEKRGIAARALLAAAGVVLDARVDREMIVVGAAASVEAEVWTTGTTAVEVRGVRASSPAGWSIREMKEVQGQDRSEVRRWQGEVEVPAGAKPTLPYFLERPRVGDLYDWNGVTASLKGEPFSPPPVLVVFSMEIQGVPVEVEREAVFRYADQALGEVRRPIRAVPKVEIELDSDLVLWRRQGSGEAGVGVVVRSNVSEPLAGTLTIEGPEGWKFKGDPEFSIARKGGRVARIFEISPPESSVMTRARFLVQARVGHEVFHRSFPVLEYPHIRPRASPQQAHFDVSVVDLELPGELKVGYVAGASDRVPAVLARLGIDVSRLAADQLSLGDLSSFDAIVVGSRAYEIDDELRRSNARLLDYVKEGGVLIVQYQQYQFVEGRFSPYDLRIARPHGRVTDEQAEVRIIDAASPILSRPNKIFAEDWDGWVQERGLYFPGAWDERFEPLLAMNDEGREEERGALLLAPYGDGLYVYTGLSFFRQLPAGVAGAIRLFANLLAAGRTFEHEEVLR